MEFLASLDSGTQILLVLWIWIGCGLSAFVAAWLPEVLMVGVPYSEKYGKAWRYAVVVVALIVAIALTIYVYLG